MNHIPFPNFAFVDGQIVPWEDANVPISTHALHYGTGCYEGIRAYWSKEKERVSIFQGKKHYQRLLNSCKIMFIKLDYSVEELCSITKNLILKNEFKDDLYIRPVAYKKLHPTIIGPVLDGVTDGLFVLIFPLPQPDQTRGKHLGTSSWRRINDTAIPPRGKICGTYVNTALARTEAVQRGFDDAIFLTQEGFVSEGGTSNLVMIRNGVLITPPPYMDILEGITLDSTLRLAKDLGLPVEDRPIQRSELYVAEEIFSCGTASEIVSVTHVDHRAIGDGNRGPITKRLQDEYRRVAEGKNEKYADWLEPVI